MSKTSGNSLGGYEMRLKQKIRQERRKKVIMCGTIVVVMLLLLIMLAVLFINSSSGKDNKVNVRENKGSLEIETKYGPLYYPSKWKDQIDIKYTENAGYKVEFYGTVVGKESVHLFDICFNSDNGELLGYFNREEAVNVSFNVYEVKFDETWTQGEKDQIYSMQEDVNYVIEMLEKEDDYVNPEL